MGPAICTYQKLLPIHCRRDNNQKICKAILTDENSRNTFRSENKTFHLFLFMIFFYFIVFVYCLNKLKETFLHIELCIPQKKKQLSGYLVNWQCTCTYLHVIPRNSHYSFSILFSRRSKSGTKFCVRRYQARFARAFEHFHIKGKYSLLKRAI